MTWGIAAGAAVSAVGGFLGASSSNKAAAAQAKAQSTQTFNAAAENFRNTEIKYKQLQQDYAATNKQNLMTQVRQNYRMGLMNVQQGLNRREATAQGFNTSQQAQAFLGAVSANAAAAQVIGASADAVKNDITMKAGEAQVQHFQNYNQQLQNFNAEVEAMKLNNETQFQSPQEIVTSSTAQLSDPINGGVQAAYTNPWAHAAVAGVGSAASTYMKNKTSLNLGPAPSTPGGLSQSSASAFTSPLPSPTLGSGMYNLGGSQSSASPINGGWSLY